MLDAPHPLLRAEPSAPLPVEALARGRSREDVAALMPRLFNLCAAAQSLAARRALGLSAEPGCETTLRREILRDHILHLAVVLPAQFGQAPMPLPAGWQEGHPDLGPLLFGAAGRLPPTLGAFDAAKASGQGVAGLWQKVEGLFGRDARVAALPFVSDETAATPDAAVENSPARRVARHPVVAGLAARDGRGPLWRLVARCYDLEARLDGIPLHCCDARPGTAHVEATRGLYTVQARCEGETVTAFRRVTPTDHLQAPGGVLAQSLAALPVDRAALAPLLLKILDPCSPIRIREDRHA